MQRDRELAPGEMPYARFGIPEQGFRNYWYPILAARKLGRRPRAVTLLGEEIVLYRDGGRVFALADRCPHRGVKLSAGACRFPGSGTISCAYHGWTFDGATGELRAALMEGPDATIVGKVRISHYPVTERSGLIFVFVGDMAAPPLEEDLNDFMADEEHFFSIAMHTDYDCNWRLLTDNWAQDHHGPYVHGNSPELILQPHLPFAQKVVPEELPDGKGLGIRAVGGVNQAEYPGLGRYPRQTWFRVMKPSGRGAWTEFSESKAYKLYGIRYLIEVRLPSYVVVGRQHGEYCLVQWAVPIDHERTRLFNVNCFRRMGRWREITARLDYAVWRGWAHDRIFSDQDKRVVEALVAGPERLSRTDIGVVAWRKFAGANARQPAVAEGRIRVAQPTS
jgi:phenylpropionate dioxygenase-like ring-hydroxylating dioxygenase large terminal subunit